VFLLFVGAIANPGIVWLIADILDAFTAFPNPVALLALPGTVFAATKTCVER
jgi:AGCS family alanine or glycine:cation symporter